MFISWFSDTSLPFFFSFFAISTQNEMLQKTAELYESDKKELQYEVQPVFGFGRSLGRLPLIRPARRDGPICKCSPLLPLN